MRIACVLVFFAILAGCTASPQAITLSSGAQLNLTTYEQRNNFGRPDILEQLSLVDLAREPKPYRFTINPAVLPRYKVYVGALPDGAPVVVTAINLGQSLISYSIFEFTGLEADDQVRLSSFDNWPSIADEAALSELAYYANDCSNLPRPQAEEKYGLGGVFDVEVGGFLGPSSGVWLECWAANFYRSYAIVFEVGPTKFLASNIAGEVFVQELEN